MEQKEKLVELVGIAFEGQENDKCQECDVYDCVKCVSEYVANYLIANGVVVLPCMCCECDYHDHDGGTGYCNYWRRWSNMSDYCNHGKRKGGDE